MNDLPVIALQWPDPALLACARNEQKPRGAAQLTAADYNLRSEGQCRAALNGVLSEHRKHPSAKLLITFCPPKRSFCDSPGTLKEAVRPALRGVATALGVSFDRMQLGYAIGPAVIGGQLTVQVERLG